MLLDSLSPHLLCLESTRLELDSSIKQRVLDQTVYKTTVSKINHAVSSYTTLVFVTILQQMIDLYIPY